MTQTSSPGADAPLDLLLARREWVRRFARTLARDDAAADDLAQDAFVTAIERPPETLDRPGGWLRRVVTNRAMDLARGARRRVVHETRAARGEASADVADVVAAAEMHRRVVEAVVALDEPLRTTVLLRFFEDLPPREVARRMGVPVETVRSRVRRAAAILRTRLDADHGGARAVWLAPLVGDDGSGGGAASGARRGAPAGGEAMGLSRRVAGAAAVVVAAGVAWFLLDGAPPQDPAGADVGAAPEETPVEPANDDAPSDPRQPRGRTRATPSAPAESAVRDAVVGPAAEPAPAAPVEEARVFVVQVVDGDGNAAPDVRVVLDPAQMDAELSGATDAAGIARFRVVGAVRSARVEADPASKSAWRPRARQVEATPGIDRCTLVVDAAQWIRGTVVRTRRWDGAAAPDTPFSGAEVLALADDRPVARTRADAHGAFAIAVPPGDRFDLVLTGHAIEGGRTIRRNTRRGRVAQQMETWAPITGEARDVAPGADDVRISATAASGTGTLRVRVVDEAGAPVPDIPVFADLGLLFTEPAPSPVTTDADGRATLNPVPRRRVTVRIRTHPVERRPWEDAGLALPRTWPFVLCDADDAAEPREITLVLPRGTVLRGTIEAPADFPVARDAAGATVVDATVGGDAQPVVTVAAEDTGELLGACRADAEGRFALRVAPTPGVAQRVVVYRDDARGESWKGEAIAPPGGADVTVRLVKEPPPPVYGARVGDPGITEAK